MQLSLLEGLSDEEKKQEFGDQQTQGSEQTNEQGSKEGGDEPPSGSDTPAATQQQGDDTKPDLDVLIAQRTGDKFKTVDELIAAAEKPVNQDINFANDLSKQVFDFLKEGKIDDFISVYEEQKMLRSVDSMETSDVLRLKIKYENPDLSKEEVEEEFLERYGVEPLDIDEELDDEDEVQKKKKAHERQLKAAERLMKKDLKEAKDYLSQKSQEIVLPNIEKTQKQEPAQSTETTQEDLQAIENERKKYIQSVEPAMKELGDSTVTYKDDDVEITTKVSIDEADKAELKKQMDDFYIMDYFGSRYIKEDGTFDTKTIAKDLYELKNMNKIIQAHVAQAVQQTKSQLVAGIKNADYQEPVRRDRGDDEAKAENQMVDYFFSRT